MARIKMPAKASSTVVETQPDETNGDAAVAMLEAAESPTNEVDVETFEGSEEPDASDDKPDVGDAAMAACVAFHEATGSEPSPAEPAPAVDQGVVVDNLPADLIGDTIVGMPPAADVSVVITSSNPTIEAAMNILEEKYPPLNFTLSAERRAEIDADAKHAGHKCGEDADPVAAARRAHVRIPSAGSVVRSPR